MGNDSKIECNRITSIECPDRDSEDVNLIDFCFDSKRLFVLWDANYEASMQLYSVNYLERCQWEKCLMADAPAKVLNVQSDQHPSNVFMDYIFSGAFSTSVIKQFIYQMQNRHEGADEDEVLIESESSVEPRSELKCKLFTG